MITILCQKKNRLYFNQENTNLIKHIVKSILSVKDDYDWQLKRTLSRRIFQILPTNQVKNKPFKFIWTNQINIKYRLNRQHWIFCFGASLAVFKDTCTKNHPQSRWCAIAQEQHNSKLFTFFGQFWIILHLHPDIGLLLSSTIFFGLRGHSNNTWHSEGGGGGGSK